MAAAVLITGCAKDVEIKSPGSGSGPDARVEREVPSQEAKNNALCDPFNGNDPVSPKHGILARIHYLKAEQPRYHSLKEYFEFGHEIDQDLFLNWLMVPTRHWEFGFQNDHGDVLLNDQGGILNEYFALNMQTSLTLAEDEGEGEYEFAILSDDGSVMDLVGQGDADDIPLVRNDKLNPSRLGCGVNTINMEQGKEYPVNIGWWQGPKYHIALILLWRKVPTDPLLRTEPLCDGVGIDFWFDSSKIPSEPTQNWNDLLSRGWRVLQPENYKLPQSVTNGCLNRDPNNDPSRDPSNFNDPFAF